MSGTMTQAERDVAIPEIDEAHPAEARDRSDAVSNAARAAERPERYAMRSGDANKAASAAGGLTKVATGTTAVAAPAHAHAAQSAGDFLGGSLGLASGLGQSVQGGLNLARSYERGQHDSASAKQESRYLAKEGGGNLLPGVGALTGASVGLAAAAHGQTTGTGNLGSAVGGLAIATGVASMVVGLMQFRAARTRKNALAAADPKAKLTAARENSAKLSEEFDKLQRLVAGADRAAAALTKAGVAAAEIAAIGKGNTSQLAVVIQQKPETEQAAQRLVGIHPHLVHLDEVHAEMVDNITQVAALTRIVDEPVTPTITPPFSAPAMTLAAAQQQLWRSARRKQLSAAGSALSGLASAAAGATALGMHGLGSHEKVGFGVLAGAGGLASLAAFGAKYQGRKPTDGKGDEHLSFSQRHFGGKPSDEARVGAVQSLMMTVAKPPRSAPKSVVKGIREFTDFSTAPLAPDGRSTTDELHEHLRHTTGAAMIKALGADPAIVAQDAARGRAADAVEYLLTVAGRA